MQDQNVQGQNVSQTALANALANAGVTMQPSAHAESGAVNFDAGIVREDAQAAAAEVERTPSPEPMIHIGGSRVLGQVPEAAAPRIVSHNITSTLYLTLNSGLTIVSGLKDLKCVGIGTNGGAETDWNLYNAFARQNDAKQSADGVLRRTLTAIVKCVHSVVGRNLVMFGDTGGIEVMAAVDNYVNSIQSKIVNNIFPALPDDVICVVPVQVDGVEVERPITFGDLFQVNTWVTHVEEDDAPVVNHSINVNLTLNVPAFYDSREPHVFVKNAYSHLTTILTKLGVLEYMAYSVVVGIDGVDFIVDDRTREMVDNLVDDLGYVPLSKSSVLSGTQDWIHSGDADKLFGYGCDIVLLSPAGSDESDDSTDGE